MNSVDRADQLRENEPRTRWVRRGGWHALFLYIFNTVLVNSYLLSSTKSQSEFRTLLYLQLLEIGASTRKRKWAVPRLESRLFPIHSKPDDNEKKGQEAGPEAGCEVGQDSGQAHNRVHRGKRQPCKGCQYSGLSRQLNKRRRVLGEISRNIRHYRAPRESQYSCLACGVSLCKEGPCFDLYHERNNGDNHQ
jgi:hypothetical protein